jgi:hypothetical protein
MHKVSIIANPSIGRTTAWWCQKAFKENPRSPKWRKRMRKRVLCRRCPEPEVGARKKPYQSGGNSYFSVLCSFFSWSSVLSSSLTGVNMLKSPGGVWVFMALKGDINFKDFWSRYWETLPFI